MSYRFAPRTEHGLAIPPVQTDCVGETCPTAEKLGACFVDYHHLYHPRKKYLSNGEDLVNLRADEHSIVGIARCRHDSTDSRAQHSMYEGVPFPERGVVRRFLEETNNLRILEAHVSDLVEYLDVYTDPETLFSQEETIDKIGRKQEKIDGLLELTQAIEVIPLQIRAVEIGRILTVHGPMIPLVNGLLVA